MPDSPEIETLGDAAVLLRWGEAVDTALNAAVHAATAAITAQGWDGIDDTVPAYASLALVCVDPAAAAVVGTRLRACDDLVGAGTARAPASLPSAPESVPTQASLEVPVCYDGADLDEVAALTGLSRAEVIARHSGGDYRVAMLGFAPGFPYLLGLDPALAVPRRATPRARVPAGSVALGGAQTGIYPREGPGGWRLIGRTPLSLFDPAREPPCLLMPGQRVRFRAIDASDWPKAPALAAGAEAPVTANWVDVVAPGLLTTVQDAGRRGWRHLGVGLAGAADAWSLAAANLLVGNPTDAAALEITLAGPRLRFAQATQIALTGAEIDARVDGTRLPGWRPITLPAGTELQLGACRRGARAYLAVAGGIAVPLQLGSRATDLRAGFGGLHGRALRHGDRLPIGAPALAQGNGLAIARWWAGPCRELDFDRPAVLHVLPGRDATAPADALFAGPWSIAAGSDRQGVKLAGTTLALADRRERISEPVAPGTIQLPPDGQPIILGIDAQTVGGYPRIGHVISADLPRLAQLRPGETVRLQPITPAQAMRRWQAQQAALARLALAIATRRARIG